MLMLVGVALAGDFFVGGAGSVQGSYTLDDKLASPIGAIGQAELDLQYTQDTFTFRADLDAHFDLMALSSGPFLADGDMVVFCPGGGTILACPRPVENLYVQLAGDHWRGTAGIQNPPIGIEGWDEWGNVLPSFSQMWGLQPSQIAGLGGGYTIGDGGTEVGLYGGYDMGWITPEFGASVAYDGDAFGTWNGAWAMPMYDTGNGVGYYGALLSGQLHLGDVADIDLSASPGLYGQSFFVGGWAMAAFLPNAVVTPAVRVEALADPDNALGTFFPTGFAKAQSLGVGAGARVMPLPFLAIQAEAKIGVYDQFVEPAIYAQLSVFRPDPE